MWGCDGGGEVGVERGVGFRYSVEDARVLLRIFYKNNLINPNPFLSTRLLGKTTYSTSSTSPISIFIFNISNINCSITRS